MGGAAGGLREGSRTPKGISQPHQSPEYKLVGVQRSWPPVENLRVIRTADGRGGRSRRRAVPGAGVAVDEDRRVHAYAIRTAIARVRTRVARQDRLIIRPELPVPGTLTGKIVNLVAAGRTSEEGRTVLNLGFE